MTTVDATTPGSSWEDPDCEALRYKCVAHSNKRDYVLLCTCVVPVQDADDTISVELSTNNGLSSKAGTLPRLSVKVSHEF
jgi:hypothetical protein